MIRADIEPLACADDELNVISVDEWFTGVENSPIQITSDKRSITFDLAPGENRIFEFWLN